MIWQTYISCLLSSSYLQIGYLIISFGVLLKAESIVLEVFSFVCFSLFVCFPLAFEPMKSPVFLQVGHFLPLLPVLVYIRICQILMTIFFPLMCLTCSVSCKWDQFIENNFLASFFKNQNRFWRSLPDYLPALQTTLPYWLRVNLSKVLSNCSVPFFTFFFPFCSTGHQPQLTYSIYLDSKSIPVN